MGKSYCKELPPPPPSDQQLVTMKRNANTDVPEEEIISIRDQIKIVMHHFVEIFSNQIFLKTIYAQINVI